VGRRWASSYSLIIAAVYLGVLMGGVFGRVLRVRRRQKRVRVRARTRRERERFSLDRVQARRIAVERLEFWSTHGGFRYGKVSIRDQRTRWGSCSSTGDLSLNYRIAFLPAALLDYVVVHELCHTVYHDHSASFWSLVGTLIPEHRSRRSELRQISRALFSPHEGPHPAS
jgi:hypothetical protein